MALMEKAAGQGHAWAMHELARRYGTMNEDEQGLAWITKAAEAGLPGSMFSLGRACRILLATSSARTLDPRPPVSRVKWHPAT
jgi:TPR repeat protein